MVAVSSETGARLVVDDEVAQEFNVKRGSDPVTDEILALMREKQIKVRTIEKKLDNIAPDSGDVILAAEASLL